MDLDQIHKKERVALGDDDLRKHLGSGTKILTYPQLANYKSLEQLLPKKDSYVVLLYLQTKNSGHWTCLSRHKDTVEFFCSYGSKPDEPLSWIPKETAEELGVARGLLTELFDNDKSFKKVYNHIDYQNDTDTSISTCGDWVILRLKHRDIDLNHFYLLMKQLKAKYKLDFDELSVAILEKKK
jgi:hypothetical protein